MFRGKFLTLLFKKPNLPAHSVPRKVTEPACTLYSPKWSFSSHVRPFSSLHSAARVMIGSGASQFGRKELQPKQSPGGALVFGTNTPPLLTFRESFQSKTMLWERAGSISGPNTRLIHL